jgi:APA family basic amino acid/polyamine antiporter
MMDNNKAKIGLLTASSIVIANMIGTGVFTSLGFQVIEIQSVFALLMLWVLGGAIAFCGAVSYGELGTALPRSGGEYHLLSKVYHPAMGFLSGWISATIGFAAPTALAAVALGKYLAVVYPTFPVDHIAAGVVVFFAFIHITSVGIGSFFQVFFTIIKIGVVLFFIVAGLLTEHPQNISVMPDAQAWSFMATAGFAVSLVYVSYAFTGWNAAIYVVGELKNPSRNLPLALLLSTVLVTVLYTLINYVFLLTVPMQELAGKIEVGFLVGTKLFQLQTANLLSIMIAVLMLSTVSAMVFVGARITQVMGEDYLVFKFLAKKSKNDTPVNSIIFQTIITLLFIYTSTFEEVMIYAGFTLALLTSVTVAGVFVLRYKQPDLHRPYKTWGYPYTPALFLLANSWITIFVLIDKPKESLIGLTLIVFGFFIFYLNKKIDSI